MSVKYYLHIHNLFNCTNCRSTHVLLLAPVVECIVIQATLHKRFPCNRRHWLNPDSMLGPRKPAQHQVRVEHSSCLHHNLESGVTASITPSCDSPVMSLAVYPSSCSTLLVCSPGPGMGPGWSLAGVRDRVGAGRGTNPPPGSFIKLPCCLL